MKDTVSLVMIVKNEAANLKKCLDSARDQADEIVIVDTGSTDGTREIAAQYTGKIFSFPWEEDFSAARNFALDRAEGTWVLSLDADETLAAEPEEIKSLITRNPEAEAFLLPIDNMAPLGTHHRFLVLRLFKNNSCCRWQGKIHEQVTVPKERVVGIAEKLLIRHKSLPPEAHNKKRGRNLLLLKKALASEPDNPFLLYYLGTEWLLLGKAEQAVKCLSHSYAKLPDSHLQFKSPTLRHLLIALQLRGNIDEAIVLCLEASLRYPEYTDIFYLGGVLFEERGEFDVAVKWLLRAIELGTPPPLFSHQVGSGSFLACYHLGYCHEMLGQTDESLRFYTEALEANPGFPFPVYSLFFRLLVKYGPAGAQEFLAARNYWNSQELAFAAANLLETAGNPHLALLSLENAGSVQEGGDHTVFHLGKYSFLCGRLSKCLEYLKEVPLESVFNISSRIYRALALILLGKLDEGKKEALRLWSLREARSQSRVLLSLAHFLQKGAEPENPAVPLTPALYPAAREIFAMVRNYLPEKQTEEAVPFTMVTGILEAMVKSCSPQGCLDVAEFYHERARETKRLFQEKFLHCQ